MRQPSPYRTTFTELKDLMRERGMSIETLLNYAPVSKSSVCAARTGNRITHNVKRVILEAIEDYDRDHPKRPIIVKPAPLTDEQREVLDRAQREFDMVVDEGHRLFFETRIYTKEEIEAIKDRIVPINRITKQAFEPEINPFAEMVVSKALRRHENVNAV